MDTREKNASEFLNQNTKMCIYENAFDIIFCKWRAFWLNQNMLTILIGIFWKCFTIVTNLRVIWCHFNFWRTYAATSSKNSHSDM